MLPLPNSKDAIFLDFDGTLVDIAPSPSQVHVSAELIELLQTLQVRLAGALAIISGRPIESLDTLLAPLKLAAAGEHGCEIRFRKEDSILHAKPLPVAAAREMTALADSFPGTEVEIKTASAAVHFRQAPDLGPQVLAAVKAVTNSFEGYELLHGKMVAELKPAQMNKGIAIRTIAQRAPFRGRRPVYIGDDVTDEAGFIAVNELGGLSIRAGLENNTAARYRVDGVNGVHTWLRKLN
jgi:trehalose 6-phosphate phosphatase